MSPTATPPPELTLVMPVHNEPRIDAVLRDWSDELDRLGIDYELRIYDDGSTDGSDRVLAECAARLPRLSIARHRNRGHGPTLLRAYAEATGEWVFQTDSDGELTSAGFSTLWAHRQDFDLLLGVRDHPHPQLRRRLLSLLAQLAVRLAFGAKVKDVNVPYRLIRRRLLEPLLAQLPRSTFAPNVALTGLALRRGLRLFEAPVPVERRASRSSGLAGLAIARSALRCARETLAIAWHSRSC